MNTNYMRNHSNWTGRFPRTYEEATGRKVKSWDFQPTTPAPDVGDKWVMVTCLVVMIVLPIASYAFGWKIGG